MNRLILPKITHPLVVHIGIVITQFFLFSSTLSIVLLGQSSTMNFNSWTTEETLAEVNPQSPIPSPSDPLSAGLIYSLALTAAICSSWVIPEVALAMSDRVTSLHATPNQDTSQTSPDQPIPEDSNTDTQDEPNSTQDMNIKMLRFSQQFRQVLGQQMLEDSLHRQQDFLRKTIDTLNAQNEQLNQDLERAKTLPLEIVNQVLQAEAVQYIPNLDDYIEQEILKRNNQD
ncbi:hypothetical protein [Coleofasciculus sp. E2-BRE-01]|uniref:hypothetical protein n=1 Tax=Coleofasciculus sp. E2-BRE-01 TaxID=3069524 RepID=UPI0032FC1FA0